MKGIVQHYQDTKVIPLGGGTDRRILSYDDSLMAVEVSFETGSEGAPHTHPHTQLSYVLSGSFRYSVEDESVILNPGDSIVVPSGLTHGTVCLEKGVIRALALLQGDQNGLSIPWIFNDSTDPTAFIATITSALSPGV